MTVSRPTYPEAARALLAERLLDAVDHLLRQRPWADVTMAEIAADAGVSRQTVYNEFGGREGIAQAYVLREAVWFIEAAKEAVRANAEDPRAALDAAFDHFLSAASDHPLLRAIAGRETTDELLLMTIHGEPVVSTAADQLAECFVATWPQIGMADAHVVADTLVRLALSHAALPGGTPEQTAHAVTRILGPHLDELVGVPRDIAARSSQ
jgi:AcrR family transcriptional regulator